MILKEKLFNNMSDRAGLMLKEDLDSLGPTKMSDVEKGQQKIIAVCKKLEDEGTDRYRRWRGRNGLRIILIRNIIRSTLGNLRINRDEVGFYPFFFEFFQNLINWRQPPP